MKTLYVPNEIDEEHLKEVIGAMGNKGNPEIRVVDCGDYYVAIEGSHRIRAAYELGININMTILDEDDMVDAATLDIDYFDADETYTAGEIAGEIYGAHANVYWVDDDGNLELQ